MAAFRVLTLVLAILALGSTEVQRRFESFVKSAYEALSREEFETVRTNLEHAVVLQPEDIDANQLLGTVLIKLLDFPRGIGFLAKAVELTAWKDPAILSNYIESLRLGKEWDRAREVVVKSAFELYPDHHTVLYNSALVARDLRDLSTAAELLQKSARANPKYYQSWDEGIEVMMSNADYVGAEAFAEQANRHFPNNHRFLFLLGVTKHHQTKLDEALELYKRAVAAYPDAEENYAVYSTMGAAYQALGLTELSEECYKKCMPFKPMDVGIRNNYGALVGTMNRKEEEVKWLKEALEIDPNMEMALTNLGGYYQDEGELDVAAEYLQRAFNLTRKSSFLRLRVILMLSPVSPSWAHMITQRNVLEANLTAYLGQLRRGEIPHEMHELDSNLDRIHFYLVYHGVNDRPLQEAIIEAYRTHIKDLEYLLPPLAAKGPSLAALQDAVRQPTRRVRIAFMSKFFGIFEPHGLLLDGVMRSLPRTQFEVIALPVARTDGKPLSPNIVDCSDRIVEMSLSHAHAVKAVEALDLDILVLADTMSEPMTHFLAHSRMATVQVAFWGNPITSGSRAIDYFVSADCLEHPFRSRMPPDHEPYTEQVVLLEGQGIWYNVPEPPEVELRKTTLPLERLSLNAVYDRAHFNFSDTWALYFCPQSVFKIHPEFDTVFADILRAHPQAHVVITGGRRPAWTTIYMDRLKRALGTALFPRLHMIERVSSEKFLALLRLADVILHPFPFDGSRTSADGLVVNVPVITLPTEYLRGRMGAAFFRTMNMPELVARNRSEYVQMATRLGSDRAHRDRVRARIEERLPLIWEDMEYVDAWYRFLCTAAGLSPLNWEAFIAQTGRDVAKETLLRDTRRANRAAFDLHWGREEWLLQDGVAWLEERLTPEHPPRIFQDWARSADFGRSPTVRSDERQSTPPPPVAGGGQRAGKSAALEDLQAQRRAMTDRAAPVNINVGSSGLVPESILQPIVGARDGDLGPDVGALAEGSKNVSDAEALQLMVALARAYRLEESADIAVQLHRSGRLAHDPNFLLDLCGIQFFRGEYAAAFDAGNAALALQPDAVLAAECVGVSGLYLDGRENDALQALTLAWQMETTLQARLREEGREASERSAVATVPGQLASQIFTQTTESIEINLLTALRSRQRFKECVEISSLILGVPTPADGGAYLMTFAAVNWSAPSVPALARLGQRLAAEGRVRLPPGRAFHTELARVQASPGMHALNVALYCLAEVHSLAAATEALLEIVGVPDDDARPLPTAATRHDTGKDPGVALITQYFRSKSDPAQQTDVDSALVKNLVNPHVSEVYLLTEERLDLAALGFPHGGKTGETVTQEAGGVDRLGKLRQVVVGERLTFATALGFANDRLAGRTVALANADIYFDESLRRLRGANLHGHVFALLKWLDGTRHGRDEIVLNLRTDSQDAWVFQPPLNASIVHEAQFIMGATKCDNRIAEIFATSGHPVSNPAFALHAVEIHTAERDKSGLYGTKGAPWGPTREVLLSDQVVFV